MNYTLKNNRTLAALTLLCSIPHALRATDGTVQSNIGTPAAEVSALPVKEELLEKEVTSPENRACGDCSSTPKPEVTPPPVGNEPLDYESTFALMKDFLNLSVKPHERMTYWVKQFMGLIKQKGHDRVQALTPFLREFNTALRSRQATLVGLAFKNHKEQFGEPELTEYIKKQLSQPNGLTAITNILKTRLSK